MKILLAILIPLLQEIPNDTIIDIIDTVSVSATIKSSTTLDNQALAATSFKLSEIENQQINSVKDVSVSVPNFYQPKYGSRITSTIYIRGFGSRIDQPAMGLGAPVYLTVDMDVLDPSEFPGTGTQEAGGLSYTRLVEDVRLVCSRLNVVAADNVELNPMLDQSGRSTALACKFLREELLALRV